MGYGRFFVLTLDRFDSVWDGGLFGLFGAKCSGTFGVWGKNRRKRGWKKKPKVRGKSAETSHGGETRINSGVSGALSPFGGFDTPFLGWHFFLSVCASSRREGKGAEMIFSAAGLRCPARIAIRGRSKPVEPRVSAKR